MCTIKYINKTKLAPAVKTKLANIHQTIFDRIKQSNQFSSFNQNGRTGFYVAEPSQFSKLRETQFQLLGEINNSYKSQTQPYNVVGIVNGRVFDQVRDLVYVNVLSLQNEVNALDDSLSPFLKSESVTLTEAQLEEFYQDSSHLESSETLTNLNETQQTIQLLADQLFRKTGIPYTLVNDSTLPFKGKFEKGERGLGVILNLAKANKETVLHEYLHPFVLAIKLDNPSLYAELVKEVETNHQDVINKSKDRYDEHLMEEVITQVLTNYISRTPSRTPTIIQQFKNWLYDFISWMSGVPVEKINRDLKLFKLAQEFTLADTIQDKLDSVNSFEGVIERFELSDDNFSTIVEKEDFRDIVYSLQGKVNNLKKLVEEKSNIIRNDNSMRALITDIESFVKPLYEEMERTKDKDAQGVRINAINEATLTSGLIDYLTSISKITKKVSLDYLGDQGLFSNIDKTLKRTDLSSQDRFSLLNKYLRDLESARNFFHLFTDLKGLLQLQDNDRNVSKDDYNRTVVLDFLQKELKAITMNPAFKQALKADTNVYDTYRFIEDLVNGFNQGHFLTIETANRIKGMLKHSALKNFTSDLADRFDTVLLDNLYEKTGINALTDINENINNVKTHFYHYYRSLLTDILWDKVPKKASIIRNGVEVPLTKELLYTQLQMIDQDTGTLDTWLSASISSSDGLTGITARFLDQILRTNQLNIMNAHQTLRKEYEKANPQNQNAEEFHQKYIGEMKVLVRDEDGNFIQASPSDTDFIISPYTQIKYKTTTRKRFKTEQREDLAFAHNQLFNAESKQLGFDFSLLKGVKQANHLQTLKTALGDQNATKVWQMLIVKKGLIGSYTDPTHINDEYFKLLYELYTTAQNAIPVKDRLQMSEIPQIRKPLSFKERLNKSRDEYKEMVIEGKTGTWFSRFIKWLFKSMESEDLITKPTLSYLDGQQAYKPAVRFTKRLESDALLEDLFSSTLGYFQSAQSYSSFSYVEPTLHALKTLLVGDTSMDVFARDAIKTEGNFAKFNGSVNKFLLKKTGLKANVRLLEFINQVAYEEDDLEDQKFRLLGTTYSLSKGVNKLLAFTSLQGMAFNIVGGIANMFTGNINNISLAAGGEYFNAKDYASAVNEYRKFTPDFIKDFSENNVAKKSKATQLMMYFDAIQGEFLNLDGTNLNETAMNKLMSTNTLFFQQNIGEHQIQMTGMIAMLKGMKTDSGKSYWDLISVDENGLVFDKEFTNEIRESFRTKLHALNKQLHGNYNDFDKTMLQRRWYGRLALMFRKFIYPAFRSRFGGKKYDYELEEVTQGYYNLTYRHAYNYLRNLINGSVQISASASAWNQLSTKQQAAIKRTTFETAVFIGALLVAKGLARIEFDDDDDILARNIHAIQLQAMRIHKDFGIYNPLVGIEELMSIIRSPTVAIPTITRTTQLLFQLMPWNISEEYERKTGIAEKGDNKAWTMLLKSTPVLRQILNLLNPEEQLKFYTMITRNAS